MARGMSEDVSAVIAQALARGLSRAQISSVVGVSKRAITRLSTNLNRYGTCRPPPTGARMGRPARLTRAQAEATLLWAAEHNYTFYIKDLVQHLRDTTGYAGCEGTVRRCLTRAGFTRKLPWRKSQITTWLPPEHGLALRTILEPARQPAPELGTESRHADDAAVIDPSLEDLSVTVPATLSSSPSSSLPSLSAPHSNYSSDRLPSTPATSPPKRRRKPHAAAANLAPEVLTAEVAARRKEVARQGELISRLRRGLVGEVDLEMDLGLDLEMAMGDEVDVGVEVELRRSGYSSPYACVPLEGAA